MSNVFVEARPKGKAEGQPITDFVVEDHADHCAGNIQDAKRGDRLDQKNGHSPHVARVRHLNDKKKPDHWRLA